MNDIDSLYEDKTINDVVHIDKVLCIFEGKDELTFTKKIYELFNQPIACRAFLDKRIELSWGKDPIFWKNIDKCNFQGGNLTGCPVPMPVLESLNASDLEIYKAILVVFDSDCDINQFVENTAKAILVDCNYYIFVSDICFEKTAMEFIKNETTDGYINTNYTVIDDSKCKWYKDNYGNIPKVEYFRRVQSLEKVIKILRLEDIENLNLSLNDCIKFIKNNIG